MQTKKDMPEGMCAMQEMECPHCGQPLKLTKGSDKQARSAVRTKLDAMDKRGPSEGMMM